MQRYKEIEHTADIGVEIYGATLEELFQNAGYALFDTIVDVEIIEPIVAREVRVEGPDIETLLMNWLRELLFLFSVEQDVYSVFKVQFAGGHNASHPLKLAAILKGEPLDFQKHTFETEIKAITYHQFAVVRQNGHWQARVIFDV